MVHSHSFPPAVTLALLCLCAACTLAAEPAPGSLTLDLGGGVKMELVRIQAGTFTMGTPEPAKPSFTAADARRLKIIGGTATTFLLLALCVASVKRRRFTFSLRWLLLLIAAAGWALGGWARERQAVTLWSEYEAHLAVYSALPAEEKLAHPVTISKPFYMAKYEVTQEQYEAVMGNTPSHFKGPKKSVEQISWDDAQDFCRKLSQKSGKTLSLPTEAQWEYACRAGTTTLFYFGNTIDTDKANYNGNYTEGNGVKGIYRQKTTDVGSFKPNAFGLYDMHGNVWEWCQDCYDEKYYATSPPSDPQGPATGMYRVLRGGSWGVNPWGCRSAYRYYYSPGSRFMTIGFRVCLPLDF